MFSGLSNYLKKILPKRLFYRALLIVAIPVLVLQLVITIVFFDSLWIKTNKGMTRTLVNEISTFIEAYESEQENKQELLDLFSIFLDLNIEFTNNEKLQNTDTERWFSPIDRTLRRELKSKFGLNEYWFDTTSYKELIDLRIKYEDGYFKFLVPKDRVASSSARIFALWITVPAIIMVIISLIFLKNQTRPITNLARAAERFGKGENIEEFKPSGALEIRQAGHEFDKMRKRIERHINQRTEMLSGISHDLRTPLTRMKLQLAFIKDKETVNKLTEDINEMEKMLNEYLQFTSSSYVEKDEMFNLSELISEVIEKYNNENISQNLFNGVNNAFAEKAGDGVNILTKEVDTLPNIAKNYSEENVSWVAVGDENYGEGSSREHAAMEPRFRGCKVVLVKSFARIHEANLKKQGILPLVFEDKNDYEKIEQFDKMTIGSLKDIAVDTPVEIILEKENGETETIEANHSLSEDQIAWFFAGSALNYIKSK